MYAGKLNCSKSLKMQKASQSLGWLTRPPGQALRRNERRLLAVKPGMPDTLSIP